MTSQQLEIMKKVLGAVADVIKSEPMGCPSGVIYAGLMRYGCTLEQYNQIISALKTAGKVREENHLLYWN